MQRTIIYNKSDLILVLTSSDIRKIQSLYAACIVGDLNGVVTILNAHLHDIDGNNVHAIDIDPKGYGRRPIHAATIGGHLDIVSIIYCRCSARAGGRFLLIFLIAEIMWGFCCST